MTSPVDTQVAVRSVSVLLQAVIGVLVVSCGPAVTPEPTVVSPTATTSRLPQPEQYFLQVSATEATANGAYGAAVTQLAQALFGQETWLSTIGIGIHDESRDPKRSAATGNGEVQIVLGLDRQRVVEIFDAIELQPFQASPPAHLFETLRQLYDQRLAQALCARRQALLEEECSRTESTELGERFQDLAQTIRLLPLFPDGIPLDTDRRPLRPVVVVAQQRTSQNEWVPLAGLPVTVTVPEGEEVFDHIQEVTDNAGRATFPLEDGSTWQENTQVSLDRETFLGPLADLWPAQRIGISSRRTNPNRWSLVATVYIRGAPSNERFFVGALQKQLRNRRFPARVELPAQQVQALRTGSADQMQRALPAVADVMTGQVDVLLRAVVYSEFASEMGTHRVLYEARGRVEIYDVWSGEQLHMVEETISAAGVGNERADRNAQTQLAMRLAARVLESLSQSN